MRLGDLVRNYFSVKAIRIVMAAVSYRGKKVRTVASPALKIIFVTRYGK